MNDMTASPEKCIGEFNMSYTIAGHHLAATIHVYGHWYGFGGWQDRPQVSVDRVEMDGVDVTGLMENDDFRHMIYEEVYRADASVVEEG